jgi:hypothetical protein
MKRLALAGILAASFAGPGYSPLGAQEARSQAPAFTPEAIEYFEKRIRPVLVDKCYRCHSAKSEKVKAGLLLDTREGLLKGGESGPAVIPGDVEKSLLIHAIRYSDDDLDMPPNKVDQLSLAQVHDFEQWVRMGAPDPRISNVASKGPEKTPIDFVKGRAFWSFQPVSDPPPPRVREQKWPLGDVDRFVLAKLEEKGLLPVGEADPRTLLRRVTYDLTGLPPTPEEIEEFLGDPSPEAYARRVDRLLAQPQYGERWGRHWLDLVRYADTAGCNSDYPIPQMYRYRNWVIQAFNQDKPYDTFIREQIAGDLLPYESPTDRHEKIIATGYVASTRRFASSEAGTQHLIIDDTLDNLGRTFLGLTINCARCHDHKFDPISNDDYYALYGIFSSTRYPFPGIELNKVPRDLVPLVSPEQVDAVLGPYRAELGRLEADVKRQESERSLALKMIAEADEAQKAAQAREAELAKGAAPSAGSPASSPQALPPELEQDPDARKKFEELLIAQAQARKTRAYLDGEIERLEKEKRAVLAAVAQREREKKVSEARRKIEELKTTLRDAQKKRDDYAKKIPVIDSAYAVWEAKEIGNAKVLLRGDPKAPGPEVPRRFLEVFGAEPLPSSEKGSGRRELAQWIASPANPLTARVMVNRIWQYHFGKGLVQTPSDWGVRGLRPTHPELLDFLAMRFVQSGWSVKAIHRLIVLSRAYRLASHGRPENVRVDPNNDWLWKYSRRRLEAEAIRDAMLAVSGALDSSMGGPHPFPPQSTWNYTQHRQFMEIYETNRRSVYLMTQRIRKHPFFAIFDGPDTNQSTAVRPSSTTPIQALYMMNDPFVHAQAKNLAARLLKARADDASRIELGYLLAFGRPPSSPEREAGLAYLAAVGRQGEAAAASPQAALQAAWESYARVLFRTNEFIYVD